MLLTGDMGTTTPRLPSFDAPAEEWIARGLATLSRETAKQDLKGLTFDAAQAKKLVFLSGTGALALEREGLRHDPTANDSTS
jgi:hypothetical protein